MVSSYSSTTKGSSHSASMNPMRTLLQVHDRLAVAFCSVKQAPFLLPLNVKNAHYVPGISTHTAKEVHAHTPHNKEDPFEPLGLRLIYGFCEDLLHSHAFKHGKVIVICSGSHPKDITNTALLVGSFMVLNYDLDLDNIVEAFEPISRRFVTYDDALEVHDCLSALHHVNKHCGWLQLSSKYSLPPRQLDPSEHNPNTIDMEEYVHYDSPLNGTLHVLVPDRLLVFNCPTDLPAGAPWADCAGVRTFSPAYYADLFGDFGVAVVVRGCGDGAYDPSPFAAQGIEVEDLLLDGDGAPTLSAIDRFLSLARRAPGAVAVHGGAGAGLGAAGALIAAHLMGAHAFLAQDAIAWLRMVHPGALPADHQRFLLEHEARVRAAHLPLPASAAGAASPPAPTLPRCASVPRPFDLQCAGLDALWPARPAAGPPRAHELGFCPLGRTPSTF
jgi:hypothetical protein